MKMDFSNVKNAVSGSMQTAKAALLFYPPKQETVQIADAAPAANAGTLPIPGAGAVGAVSAAAKSVVDDTCITVTFQFNPASLRISAYGSGMESCVGVNTKDGGEVGSGEETGYGQVNDGPISETATVRFKAVFDAVKNEKAFPSDRANPGPTNMARQGVGLLRRKEYTVRPLVEGFLAAVRNSSKRQVIFQWGELRYGGFLSKVQCHYTMFDIEGEAVRAEVDLALVCSCHEHIENGKEWRDRYDRFLKQHEDKFSLPDKKWQSLFRATVGRLEKACILFRVRPTSPSEPTVKPPESPVKPPDSEEVIRLSQIAAVIAKEAQNPTKKKKAKAVKKTDKAEKGAEGEGTEEAAEPELGDKVKKQGYAPVKIHYNPASVTIYSGKGNTGLKGSGSTEPSDTPRLQQNAMSTETVLSMDLFFDETDNANAFMLDSGMSSPTGLVMTGKNMVSRVKGREYSVAPISELFVSAALSDDCRLVCFVWNKMVFWGQLCEAEVEYTMFNNRGNPIRSKVSIRICQTGNPEQCGSYEELWQNAYDNLPKEAEKLASDKGLTGSSWNHIASNLFHM